MEDREIRPRSGVPLGHKLLAFTIAVAVAAGICGWNYYQSTLSASTAVLSFDPDQARQADPGVLSAKTPAIALAEMILNDQTVARLAKQAQLSATTPAGQIGQFRAGLALTQPSPKELRVRYLDTGSGGAAITNAIAQALQAGAPAPGATPAAADHLQAPAPPVTPAAATGSADAGTSRSQDQEQDHAGAATAAPASSQPEAKHPVSDSLGDLVAELEATNRDLDRLSGTRRGYRESSQQQMLKSRVRAAEKKLEGIQTQYGRDNPGIRARLARVHQALSLIFQHSAYGFNGAGTSAREVRRERAQLIRAIGVVNQEHSAMERLEASQPAPRATPSSAAAPAAKPAPAAPPAASPQPSSSLKEQNLPPAGGSGASQAAPQPATTQTADQAGKSGPSPLHVVRLANPAAVQSGLSPRMLRGILIGIGCGLFYLAIAWLLFRVSGSHETYTDESSDFPPRFITPSGPVGPRREVPSPAEDPGPRSAPPAYSRPEPARDLPPASAPEPEPVMATAAAPAREIFPAESSRRQRASFAFDSAPSDERSARDVMEGVPAAVDKAPGRETSAGEASPEDAAADSALSDRIRQSISHTSIGRMFEEDSSEAVDKTEEEKRDAQQEGHDRLAG